MDRSTLTHRAGAWKLLPLAALLLLPSAGCVLTKGALHTADAPPAQALTKVLPLWEGRVRFAQDTRDNGKPFPGLAGHLYLFGADEKFPVHMNGQLVVEMADVTAGEDKARPCGQCQLDATALQKLRRKGILGDGYALFIDWPDYRPEIGRVRIRACFIPAGGSPVYADPMTITVHPDYNQVTRTERMVPAGEYQAANKSRLKQASAGMP